MSQIKKISVLGVLLLIGLLLIVSCGTSNSQSPFDLDAQQHPAGWLPAGHMNAAQADISSCRDCHGSDLAGGISKVSCTTCHIGGPTSVHPSTWTDNGTSSAPIIQQHPSYVTTNGTASCRNDLCHGVFLSGVANSGPSCANFVNDSRCHQTIPSVP